MSQYTKNKITVLATLMIISIMLTSFLFTNSVKCDDCNKRITGEYYSDGFDDSTFYCKKCAVEYYGMFFSKDMALKVDNSLRNILLIVEVIGFSAAIFRAKNSESGTLSVNKPSITVLAKTCRVVSIVFFAFSLIDVLSKWNAHSWWNSVLDIVGYFISFMFLYAIGEVLEQLDVMNSNSKNMLDLLKSKSQIDNVPQNTGHNEDSLIDASVTGHKWRCNVCGTLRDDSPCPYCGNE